MQWPFNRRADPVHAWGALALSVAIAGVIATELATLHASEANFRWWWPTNWMAVPLGIFLIGCALLIVPLQRSARQHEPVAGGDISERKAADPAGSPSSEGRSPERSGLAGAFMSVGMSVTSPLPPRADNTHHWNARLTKVLLVIAEELDFEDLDAVRSQANISRRRIRTARALDNAWQSLLERAIDEGRLGGVLEAAADRSPRVAGAVLEYERGL